jgi:S1-C subfamily serine protease
MSGKKNKKQSSVEDEVGVKAETIKEIYAQGEEIKLPGKTLPWLAVLIVTIFCGLVAGFFGGWWEVKMSPSWMNLDEEVPANQIASILDIASQNTKNLEGTFDQTTLQNFSNQTVSIYSGKGGAINVFNNLYSDDNFLGSGLVVTSDGWLVTTTTVLSDFNEDYLIITSDRQGYQPEKFVLDDYTGLVFVKIAASNLSPITISSTDSVSLTQNLVVLRNTLRYQQPQLQSVKLAAKNYQPIDKLSDYLHSTDSNDSYLLLDRSLSESYQGSLLAANSGEVVGLIYRVATDGETIAVPGFYLQVAVINFLNNQTEVKHNSLGVSYFDLAEVVGLATDLNQGYSRGGLLWDNVASGQAAVAAESAAAQADLVAGDIILTVNGQELNAQTGLNKLLQEYPLGATVTLHILSAAGEEKDVIVTLDTN